MRSFCALWGTNSFPKGIFAKWHDSRMQCEVETPRAGQSQWKTAWSSTKYWALPSAHGRSFDKVRQRAYKKGDLVLTVKRPMLVAHKSKGKFESKWEGPYVIDKVFSNDTYPLLNMKGDRCMMPTNGKFLKRYYPWRLPLSGQSDACIAKAYY